MIPIVIDDRITFFGAAGEVTGSCALVEHGRARVLVDFGMIQGAEEVERKNLVPPGLDARSIDAVVVTHAHLDHCGRLPMLPRLGFHGKVWATKPTHELLGAVLHGSARVQAIRVTEHAERVLRRSGLGVRRADGRGVERGRRRGYGGERVRVEKVWADTPWQPGIEPEDGPVRLYDSFEVDAILRRVESVGYGVPVEIASGVRLRLLDAGHVIGSASVELTLGEGRHERVIVFSGDLGPKGAPLLAPPRSPERADVVVMESTYGDRDHPKVQETMQELAGIADAARREQFRVVVPTFTLGRAQQLLYRLGQLSRDGLLGGLPVYLDSKMAVAASEAYARHPDLLDESSRRMLAAGKWPTHFDELVYVEGREDSRRLNRLRGGGIIVAGSGFCHGGPVVEHLTHTLHREDALVLLIGHQPSGTPAGDLARGYPTVVLNEEEQEVRCRVKVIRGVSGHADRTGLIEWLGGIKDRPERVILNHGERETRAKLATRIGEQLKLECEQPVVS